MELDNILTGLLTINGTDIWTQYKAFLAEKGNAHLNMDALLRLPKVKDITTVDFRERDGVDLPANVNIKLKSIERTLQFAILASSETERFTLYKSFLEKIRSGKLEMVVKDYRTYSMIYQEMTSDPEWYQAYDKEHYITVFQVKFLDYAPV